MCFGKALNAFQMRRQCKKEERAKKFWSSIWKSNWIPSLKPQRPGAALANTIIFWEPTMCLLQLLFFDDWLTEWLNISKKFSSSFFTTQLRSWHTQCCWVWLCWSYLGVPMAKKGEKREKRRAWEWCFFLHFAPTQKLDNELSFHESLSTAACSTSHEKVGRKWRNKERGDSSFSLSHSHV